MNLGIVFFFFSFLLLSVLLLCHHYGDFDEIVISEQL